MLLMSGTLYISVTAVMSVLKRRRLVLVKRNRKSLAMRILIVRLLVILVILSTSPIRMSRLKRSRISRVSW